MLYKTTKHLNWDLFNELKRKNLVIIFNSIELFCDEHIQITHAPGYGYSGFSISGKTIPTRVGRQLARYLKIIEEKLEYDIYKIDFDK